MGRKKTNKKRSVSPKSKAVKSLMKGFCSLDDLGLSQEDIINLRAEGFQVKRKRSGGKNMYYIPPNDDDNAIVISEGSSELEDVVMANFSDTHAGCYGFDADGLHYYLETAEKSGCEYAFHSGDLTDGYGVYKGQLQNLSLWKSEDQAQALADVLKEHNLKYVAIKGNHDQSFEKQGGLAVGKIIANMVPNFTYINNIRADIVFHGVLMRLIHGAGGSAYAKSYPGQVYVRNLLDANRGHRRIGGKQRRISLIQMGHFHTDIIYNTADIYVMHPGAFQGSNDFTMRRGLEGPLGGRITEMKVKGGRIKELSSRYVKTNG